MGTVVWLLSLGTPDAPDVRSVRRYLLEFLNDPRVITLPAIPRRLLTGCVIAPFRSFASSRKYREIWTAGGSPLLVHTRGLAEALQDVLGDRYRVEWAMRYGQPSLDRVAARILESRPRRILLVPLYPQYASSTTGSVLEAALGALAPADGIPDIRMIHHFHDDPGFVAAQADRIRSLQPERFDHLLLSYHGLPVSHLQGAHPGKTCEEAGCDAVRGESNAFCYRASCFETSRLLAQALGLGHDRYTVTFQSRLDAGWTRPFTDETLRRLAADGKKKILVASPSFVGDCLETLHELGMELKAEFLSMGGEELAVVPSLNTEPMWVAALAERVVRSDA